jgi:hypothetical protein
MKLYLHVPLHLGTPRTGCCPIKTYNFEVHHLHPKGTLDIRGCWGTVPGTSWCFGDVSHTALSCGRDWTVSSAPRICNVPRVNVVEGAVHIPKSFHLHKIGGLKHSLPCPLIFSKVLVSGICCSVRDPGREGLIWMDSPFFSLGAVERIIQAGKS